MAALFASASTPRPEGVQIKAPMKLSCDGFLHPARKLVFTHVLKPSPGVGLEDVSLIVAAVSEAARAFGFDTVAHAMVSMSDGLPEALLVERFDIRRDRDDRRKIAMEDMASIRGLAVSEKFAGTFEQVARAIRGAASDADADVAVQLGRAVLTWLIADGNFQLKKLAALWVARNWGNFPGIATDVDFVFRHFREIRRGWNSTGHRTFAAAEYSNSSTRVRRRTGSTWC